MEISCSTCEKEEKGCIWVKYLIYAVLHDFNFVVIYALFPPNSDSQIFRVHKKSFIPSLGSTLHYKKCSALQRSALQCSVLYFIMLSAVETGGLHLQASHDYLQGQQSGQ